MPCVNEEIIFVSFSPILTITDNTHTDIFIGPDNVLLLAGAEIYHTEKCYGIHYAFYATTEYTVTQNNGLMRNHVTVFKQSICSLKNRDMVSHVS